jgi:hypothetical protein
MKAPCLLAILQWRAEGVSYLCTCIFAERSLLEVRKLCTDVAFGADRLQLQSLTPSQTYSLEAFVQAQESQAASVVSKLRQFHRQALLSVENACADTLDALETQLTSTGGFGGDQAHFDGLGGSDVAQQVA